eukprot:5075010-Prymnesium_polylepis.1
MCSQVEVPGGPTGLRTPRLVATVPAPVVSVDARSCMNSPSSRRLNQAMSHDAHSSGSSGGCRFLPDGQT